jgi:hypothetical protein
MTIVAPPSVQSTCRATSSRAAAFSLADYVRKDRNADVEDAAFCIAKNSRALQFAGSPMTFVYQDQPWRTGVTQATRENLEARRNPIRLFQATSEQVHDHRYHGRKFHCWSISSIFATNADVARSAPPH